VNPEAAWLFVCGRDAFSKNIIGSCPTGMTVVKNEAGEALGIGEMKGKTLNNIMDVGSFLRREKNAHSIATRKKADQREEARQSQSLNQDE
jgi:ribosome biogenesis protein Nip4